MMSTLMDAVAFGLRPIGDAAIAVLKPVVSFATNVADAFGAFAERNQWLTKVIAATLIGLFALGAVLVGIGMAAMALGTVVGGLATAWGMAVAVLMAVFSPMGALIGALVLAVVTFRSQIASAFGAAASYFAPLISSLANVWAIFQQTFGGIIAVLMRGDLEAAAGIAWLGFMAATWSAVADFGTAMLAALAMLGAWIPGVDSVVAYLGESFAGVGQAILAGRWDVAGAILMAKLRLVITEGWNSILSVWTGFGVVLGNVWDSIVFGIRATWRSAVTEIAKWLVWVAEKAGFSMEGVQEELDRMRKSDQAADDRSKTTREQSRYKAGGDAIAAGEARAKQIRDEIAGLENEASGAYAAAGARPWRMWPPMQRRRWMMRSKTRRMPASNRPTRGSLAHWPVVVSSSWVRLRVSAHSRRPEPAHWRLVSMTNRSRIPLATPNAW